MSKPLPARPNLEQLKKQAKAVLKEFAANDPKAIARVAEQHPRRPEKLTLGAAQLVIAREYGFATWAKLKVHIAADQSGATETAVVKAFRDAAGAGDLDRVRELLKQDESVINERSSPGMRTALHDAAARGRTEVVKFLLDHGADPNIRCEGDYAYPIHFAAEHLHFPVIRSLIEHGADPIGEDDYHELGVIGWATAWNYITAQKDIVDYLLAHGAMHNIFSAVAMGDVEAIRHLVEGSRANLERRMDMANKRRHPLHLAVVKKQPEALAVLLKLGANTESLD